MKSTAALLLSLLASCGSGGGAPDPVTHVRLAAYLDGHAGYSTWDDGGSGVELLDTLSPLSREAVLRHELWHLLTRSEGHGNPPGCVSCGEGGALHLPSPCPEEVEQVNAAGRVETISFPEDVGCALDAAAFWNTALGREAVVVVE